MEGSTISRFSSRFSISYSNFSPYERSQLQPAKSPLSNGLLSYRLIDSGESCNVSLRASSLAKRTKDYDFDTSRHRAADKTQKLNLEVSPHRAVSAVRLMRIELGGAFADLLNEKGKGSGKNEMAYIERTLGFRTRDLDDRDLRLHLGLGSLLLKPGKPEIWQLVLKSRRRLLEVQKQKPNKLTQICTKLDKEKLLKVTEIVGGTIRWKRYLDHLITSLCHDERAFRSMEPLLMQILRIGCYEIDKLGIPPYAAVDECVRIAKVALRPGAGNLVNGILRKLALLKDRNFLPLPKVEGDDRSQARALATLYSHPVWMVRRWTKSLGQAEAVRLMMWNNSEPSFSLRANRKKGCTRADLVTQLNMLKVPHETSLHLDDFVRLKTGMQVVIQTGLLKEGLCSVQDESAGLIVSVVDPQPGDTIIDCCAAPGGKTLFMASCLGGQGMVFAIDINKGRLRILKETAKLHEVDDVVTTFHSDLRIFAKEKLLKFDKVLLDAPCSGLGVLSKRADLRWNRKLEDMEQLKNLQDDLLNAASMLVKPRGVLVYSTCSIDPEENEERVAAFLLRHPEFHIDPVDGYVPPEFVTDNGFYFSNPVKHSLDGSFAARLLRSL